LTNMENITDMLHTNDSPGSGLDCVVNRRTDIHQRIYVMIYK
jgi:hypothetical protein